MEREWGEGGGNGVAPWVLGLQSASFVGVAEV